MSGSFLTPVRTESAPELLEAEGLKREDAAVGSSRSDRATGNDSPFSRALLPCSSKSDAAAERYVPAHTSTLRPLYVGVFLELQSHHAIQRGRLKRVRIPRLTHMISPDATISPRPNSPCIDNIRQEC